MMVSWPPSTSGNDPMSPMLRNVLLATALASALAAPAVSAQQSRSADDAAAIAAMQSLQRELAVDKRAVVSEQLALSDAQAAKFWPIYDAHQQALAALNVRRMDNILAYAKAWEAGSLDDAQAVSLGTAALKLEQDETAQLERTWKKTRKALPGVLAVRYLQIESKIRALVRFEQAAQVPLAP